LCFVANADAGIVLNTEWPLNIFLFVSTAMD
jgi:hypothetical protein